jgi:hypothetical protein
MINPCELRQNRDDYEYLRRLHGTRLGRLLSGSKTFIAIANDEPYFAKVYSMIRENERMKGSWTPECEDRYQAAIAESKAQ